MRREDITPEILRRMSPEDRMRYVANSTPPQNFEPAQISPKTDSSEKAEQLEYLSHIQSKDYGYCWHGTHKAHTANVGVPDFIVAVAGRTLWIEFKRPGFKLSPEQEQFRTRLEKENVHLHVVYSGLEAIKLTESYHGTTL